MLTDSSRRRLAVVTRDEQLGGPSLDIFPFAQRVLLSLAVALLIVFPHNIGEGSAPYLLPLALAIGVHIMFLWRADVRLLSPFGLVGVTFMTATILFSLAEGTPEFFLGERIRTFIIGVVFSYLMAASFRSARDLRTLGMVVVPLVAIGALLAAIQGVTGENVFVERFMAEEDAKLRTRRMIASGFGFNTLLHGMSQMIGIACCLYWYLRRPLRRLPIVGLIAFLGLTVFLSTALSIWLGLAVMLVIFALTGEGARRFWILPLVMVIGMMVPLWLLLGAVDRGVLSPHAALSQEARTLFPGGISAGLGDAVDSRSLDQRLDYWGEAVRLFTESPLWGVGLSNFEDRSIYHAETHNIYLSFLAETGLIGFLGFIGVGTWTILAGVRGRTRRSPEDQLAWRLALSVMAGFWVIGFLWHLEFNRLYWVAFGVLVGLSFPSQPHIGFRGTSGLSRSVRHNERH